MPRVAFPVVSVFVALVVSSFTSHSLVLSHVMRASRVKLPALSDRDRHDASLPVIFATARFSENSTVTFASATLPQVFFFGSVGGGGGGGSTGSTTLLSDSIGPQTASPRSASAFVRSASVSSGPQSPWTRQSKIASSCFVQSRPGPGRRSLSGLLACA